MSDEYNGWSSYETWNTVLWLENDEDLWNIFNAKMRIFIRAGALRSDVIYCVKSSFANRFGEAVTPDGISMNSPAINWREIYSVVHEWFDLDTDEYAESMYEEWENKDSYGRELF